MSFHHYSSFTAVLLVTALVSVATPAQAQCTPQWHPFDSSTASFPGVNGAVFAMRMWDPDGAGPLAPKLVVGGRFTVAGNALANNIALYDPDTNQWSALGTGMSGESPVYALAVLPDGELVAGGY